MDNFTEKDLQELTKAIYKLADLVSKPQFTLIDLLKIIQDLPEDVLNKIRAKK